MLKPLLVRDLVSSGTSTDRAALVCVPGLSVKITPPAASSSSYRKVGQH